MWLARTSALLLLGVAACTPVSRSEVDRRSTTTAPPPAIGDSFPEVALEDPGGRLTGPRDWRGAVAIVAFASFGPGASAAESQVVIERLAEIPDRLPTTPLKLIVLRLTPVPVAPTGPVQILSAPFDRLVELAADFGIALSIGRDEYRHGHATVVIDRSGRIRAILRGVTSWDAAMLAQEVAAAATR